MPTVAESGAHPGPNAEGISPAGLTSVTDRPSRGPPCYSTDFSTNSSVLAFSTSVRTLAWSRPEGTSASISSLSLTSLPGSVVSCSTMASTIWCMSLAGHSAAIITIPVNRVGFRSAGVGSYVPLVGCSPVAGVPSPGRICVANDAAERSLCGAALGRKSWRPPCGLHAFPDRHRQAQRHRPAGLAGRCPRPHARHAHLAPAGTASLELVEDPRYSRKLLTTAYAGWLR